jgi:DNA-binding MarR family transcriptional regulator
MDLASERLAEKLQNLDFLSQHLTFRISRLSKLLEVEGALRLQNTGINLTSYRMMLVIAIFGEISVSELSRTMLIDRAQISRAAADLIERGYLEPRADRASKRKKLLVLSRKGKAEMRKLKPLFDVRQTELLSLLNEDETRALWSVIQKFSRYLEDKTGS